MHSNIIWFIFQTHHNSSPAILLVLIVEVFYQFGSVFVTCELGERLTNMFDEFDNDIGQYKWYLFPIGMQQVLPIIIENVQRPVYFECFGSISCLRESFKKVYTQLISSEMLCV